MVKIIKTIFLFAIMFLFANGVSAQGYDQERIQLAKFIERMYNNAPFDCCRIVDDYDNSYANRAYDDFLRKSRKGSGRS